MSELTEAEINGTREMQVKEATPATEVRELAIAAEELVVPSLSRADILRWLAEENPGTLESLWQLADQVRERFVGDKVHLRGLIEISNYCVRQCGYCGIRAGNRTVERYRMSAEEILACARQAAAYGYGTVVLQSGEDYGIERDWLSRVIRRIKEETGLAVTLSLGERPLADLAAWRAAGADRYLLRFETSDEDLYRHIHPPRPGDGNAATSPHDRIELLLKLREMGYEIGSGIMVGIPGQTLASVAADLELFRALDLDMIGVGPYIPHPETPLGRRVERAGTGTQTTSAGDDGATTNARLEFADQAASQIADQMPNKLADQAPNDELTVYKVLALARLLCPEANIPSTTALATINQEFGRELGLMRGANVVMPNLTPPQYRVKYEIYPGKACVNETAEICNACLRGRIEAIGRRVGTGPGGRRRAARRF